MQNFRHIAQNAGHTVQNDDDNNNNNSLYFHRDRVIKTMFSGDRINLL